MNTQNFDAFEDFLHTHSTNKIIPGLERIQRLLDRLGNPQDSFRAVHIVGTNGKGSTGAFISSVLRASGIHTAFYSSPHLESPGERLLVDGEPLAPDEWLNAAQEAASVIRDGEDSFMPSYFELRTASAFLLMRQHKIEAGVIEAGLGGKLDATNTMHNVICSVIASISIDHTEYLGPTIEDIAGEKFAVVKEGVPACFSGRPESLVPMFERVCRERGALPFVVSRESSVSNIAVSPEGNTFDFEGNGLRLEGVRTKLIGDYQIHNARLALSALSILNERGLPITAQAVRDGMLNASWPGRLEVMGRVILDGGHNLDGVRNLCGSVRDLWPGKNIGIVYAAMRDKDFAGCLELMHRELDPKLYLTTVPGMSRAATPEELAVSAEAFSWRNVPECFALPEDAVKKAVNDGNDVVIVCGSLYLVGYIRSKI